MTADEMRAALTAVLAEVPELDAEFVADRILPTVRGIAAEELGGVTEWIRLAEYGTTVGRSIAYRIAEEVDARADALGPSS